VLVWSVVLIVTAGGSRPLEWLQLVFSIVLGAYAIYAFRKGNPIHNRRCRYILLVLAIVGVVMVLGLAADDRSSRTWARLGWATLILGYLGSLIVWWRLPQHRAATIVMAVLGIFFIVSGLGLTLNCDPAIQRPWCDGNYEREQSLAEQTNVDGDFLSAGRAGGSVGAAQITYLVDDDASLPEAVDPPGEWTFEVMDPQGNEVDRGRFATAEPPNADCHIDAKIAPQPQGSVLTILVGCSGA
jgi:hypothetical protein